MFILLLLLIAQSWGSLIGIEEQNIITNESEVEKMTMDEVKEKLLDKIDELLTGANAEDVKKLSEAYSLLQNDALLEKLTENRNSLFTGVCNCDAGTVHAPHGTANKPV